MSERHGKACNKLKSCLIGSSWTPGTNPLSVEGNLKYWIAEMIKKCPRFYLFTSEKIVCRERMWLLRELLLEKSTLDVYNVTTD